MLNILNHYKYTDIVKLQYMQSYAIVKIQCVEGISTQNKYVDFCRWNDFLYFLVLSKI